MKFRDFVYVFGALLGGMMGVVVGDYYGSNLLYVPHSFIFNLVMGGSVGLVFFDIYLSVLDMMNDKKEEVPA